MNAELLLKQPAARAALAVLVVAALVLGWTIVRAWRTDALPSVAPAAVAGLDRITHPPTRSTVDIAAAVDADVFSPNRESPGGSYRMPGDPDPDAKVASEPQKPLVLGTAVATDGRSFATVQLGDSRPMLVHVGDKVGEWIVRTIERGKVTLVSNAGVRADVSVPKTGT